MKWRIFGGLSAILATLAARKLLVKMWRLATGDDPPSNPQAQDTSWPQAIGWAVISGAALGLARMFATRKAAAYYQRSTGHLPGDVEEVT
ncbi:MAG: DUF4235 domain-containing protein [Actinomycetes bacterium]